MNGQNAAAALAVGAMLLSSAEAVADPPSGSEPAQRTGMPPTEIAPVNGGSSDQTHAVLRTASVEIVRSNQQPCRLAGGSGPPNESSGTIRHKRRFSNDKDALRTHPAVAVDDFGGRLCDRPTDYKWQ